MVKWKLMDKTNSLKKDQCGLLYSTELLLSIILLIFIIGIVTNLSDDLNERILSEEEFSSLEGIAIETSNYLLNNPGNPQDWEDDEKIDNGITSSKIIPGLAIRKKETANGQFYSESASDEKVIANSISYNKLIKLKNNYELIDRNLLNNSFKSSMGIYPINCKIGPLLMGYDFDDNSYDNDIVVVERTVQCDFYSGFVLYNFNDLELYGDDYERREICNHDTNPNLENHSNDMKSYWLCKNFKVYRKSLDEYNYYLISDESIKRSNTHWILESLNRPDTNKQRLDKEVIDLNPLFMEDLENSSNEIYSIHFNVEKNHANDFKTVLVAIPKNMTNDLMANNELNYDYFKVQDVNFVLKIDYR